MKSFVLLIVAVFGLCLLFSITGNCGESSFQRERRVSQKALEIIRSRVRRQEVPDCEDDVEPDTSCSDLGSNCNYYADEAEEEPITCICDPKTNQYNCGDE